MSNGKNNIAAGLITMGGFMLYGFLLIYLRDFAPGKDEWIAQYSVGKHFESRLAHVHGNLIALLNILFGYLLLRFESQLRYHRILSWLALAGLLMPLGILAEVYFGASPIFVLIGALSITSAAFGLGASFLTMRASPNASAQNHA